MSGRRAKRLRKAFVAEYHRAPGAVEVRYWGLGSIKAKATAEGKRFVRSILGKGSRHGVSEWRRVKRAYVRRRRGASALVAA